MDVQLCPQDELDAATDGVQRRTDGAVVALERLTDRYPADARLHFLLGSLLADCGEHDRAGEALKRAVALAPDFAIARFQLGLHLLTSGRAEAAISTWMPLERSERGDPLRLFAQGLTHLARDEFDAAVSALERGLSACTDNPPLAAAMALIVTETRQRGVDMPASSAANLLLQQAALRSTKH